MSISLDESFEDGSIVSDMSSDGWDSQPTGALGMGFSKLGRGGGGSNALDQMSLDFMTTSKFASTRGGRGVGGRGASRGGRGGDASVRGGASRGRGRGDVPGGRGSSGSGSRRGEGFGGRGAGAAAEGRGRSGADAAVRGGGRASQGQGRAARGVGRGRGSSVSDRAGAILSKYSNGPSKRTEPPKREMLSLDDSISISSQDEDIVDDLPTQKTSPFSPKVARGGIPAVTIPSSLVPSISAESSPVSVQMDMDEGDNESVGPKSVHFDMDESDQGMELAAPNLLQFQSVESSSDSEGGEIVMDFSSLMGKDQELSKRAASPSLSPPEEVEEPKLVTHTSAPEIAAEESLEEPQLVKTTVGDSSSSSDGGEVIGDLADLGFVPSPTPTPTLAAAAAAPPSSAQPDKDESDEISEEELSESIPSIPDSIPSPRAAAPTTRPQPTSRGAADVAKRSVSIVDSSGGPVDSQTISSSVVSESIPDSIADSVPEVPDQKKEASSSPSDSFESESLSSTNPSTQSSKKAPTTSTPAKPSTVLSPNSSGDFSDSSILHSSLEDSFASTATGQSSPVVGRAPSAAVTKQTVNKLPSSPLVPPAALQSPRDSEYSAYSDDFEDSMESKSKSKTSLPQLPPKIPVVNTSSKSLVSPRPSSAVSLSDVAVQVGSLTDIGTQAEFEDYTTMRRVMLAKEPLQEPGPVVVDIMDVNQMKALASFNPSLIVDRDLFKSHLAMVTSAIQSHKAKMELQKEGEMQRRPFKYTTLKDTKKYIKKHRKKPMTMEEALEKVKEAERFYC